ncbi:MAG: M23 family metallopeptidase [Spirochaetales bacterium]|nr:M23 family metallopeptidase [Spirochaetales bacterium]
MKKLRFHLILTILTLVLTANAAAGTLLSTPQALPGEILTAVVYQGTAEDDIKFMLLDEEGIVRSSAPGLKYEIDELTGYNYIGFLGLSSEVKPGSYKLKAEIRNTRGLRVFERHVLVRSEDFLSEDISLNEAMTTLRSEDSEEKRDQSRKLWALLNRVSDGPVSGAGVFLSPVEEFITSAWYGDRRTYLYTGGESSSSLHNGVDMAAPTGTEILTPLEGKVVMAEFRILTGYTIVLEHMPGVYTLYYHMDSINVELGDTLIQGDLMGTVGSTGLVTGPHLHWEMRVNTIPVDPSKYLSRPLIDKDQIIAIIDDTNEQGR